MNSKQRRVKSVDVAREAGVSQATVSYVLNNDPRQSIPQETRTRVREAANKLGYQPYASARLLRSGKSKIVLLVWPESVIEAGISQLVETLARALDASGYSLVWQVGFHAEQEHLSANLTPAAVVGLIPESDITAFASLERFQAPIVTFPDGDWIRASARAQVDYLCQKGARPIVYAAPEKAALQHLSHMREEAIRQACSKHGLSAPHVQIIPQTREGARQALNKILTVQSPPFALCAYNDDVALAALAALADLKLAVPQDVAVIGIDNTIIAELSNPPLTSVGLDDPDIAEHLIASVLSVCQGGPVLDIGPMGTRIVARASA